MKKVILLNKKEGETPLEALEVFRKRKILRHPEYKNVSMTYAGRLDPMASGLLLILAGEEIKNKEKYLALDKEYEFEVLFGFATDTYDILGKVQHSNILKNVGIKEIKENLKFFTGRFVQKYPLYSSKTIKKARAGEEVETSVREVNVGSLKLLDIRIVSSKKLLENIERRIKKVRGDFRQNEILKIWRKSLFGHRMSKSEFVVGKFQIRCSSGTYVRGIAHSLGERMNTPALAFRIRRVKIGSWKRPSMQSIKS